MPTPLRIAIADQDDATRQHYRQILDALGHLVVVDVASGEELLLECAEHSPDLVIAEIRLPDLDGLEATSRLYAERPVPVIIVSTEHAPEQIRRAQEDHVLAYLVKPTHDAELETTIAIVSRRFEEFQELRREAASLRQALEERKVIERAKGILMRLANIDEPTAFRRLQKLASQKNLRLADLATMILTTEQALALDA